jgi:hypothetical protein
MTEQPKEYIITEEQLSELEEDSHEDTYGVFQGIDIANAVRSHPFNTPLEGATLDQPVNGCWYYDHNVCGLPHPSPTCDKHDAAIAQAAREQRLDELGIKDILTDLYWTQGRLEAALRDNVCIRSEFETVPERIERVIKFVEFLRNPKQKKD